jgi:CRISPR-associated endonuclease Csn1
MEGSGAQALYAFYPTREMLRHEFDLLWASQAAWHKDLLTEHSREAVAKVLFRQRPLRPPKVGKCTLVDGEERLPKALPSVEAREIYERLAHLRLSTDGVGERPLRPTERDVLASKLLAGGNLTFLQLRKALRLGGDVVINLEETGEKGLEGARTAKLLAKDNHYGRAWLHRPLADKDAFVAKLIEAEDDEALTARLMAEHGLSEAAAGECATIPLADGYSRLGATANAAILDALIHDTDADGFVVTFAEAGGAVAGIIPTSATARFSTGCLITPGCCSATCCRARWIRKTGRTRPSSGAASPIRRCISASTSCAW